MQVITDSGAFVVPFSGIKFKKKNFEIRMGENRFSSKGLSLKIQTDNCCVYGKLYFGRLQKINYDIMGPFRYFPFMQCKHHIVSMKHFVTGRVHINGTQYRFKNGVGYIEGDRGCSFPKEYIWTQCHFQNGSLMLSVADIPLLGLHFKGIIGIVLIDGREYRIATYLGAKVLSLGNDNVLVKQGEYMFYARLLQPCQHKLNAPVRGKMARMIRESVSCKAFYQFTCGDKKLLEFTSNNASFEFEMGSSKRNEGADAQAAGFTHVSGGA